MEYVRLYFAKLRTIPRDRLLQRSVAVAFLLSLPAFLRAFWFFGKPFSTNGYDIGRLGGGVPSEIIWLNPFFYLLDGGINREERLGALVGNGNWIIFWTQLLVAFMFFGTALLCWGLFFSSLDHVLKVRRQPHLLKKWQRIGGRVLIATYVVVVIGSLIAYSREAGWYRIYSAEYAYHAMASRDETLAPIRNDPQTPRAQASNQPFMVADYSSQQVDGIEWNIYFARRNPPDARPQSSLHSSEAAARERREVAAEIGIPGEKIDQLERAAHVALRNMYRDEADRIAMTPIGFELVNFRGKLIWICEWAWGNDGMASETGSLSHTKIFVIPDRTSRVVAYSTCL